MVSAELEAKTFDALGALITNIKRADGKNWRDAFENGPAYLQARALKACEARMPLLHDITDDCAVRARGTASPPVATLPP